MLYDIADDRIHSLDRNVSPFIELDKGSRTTSALGFRYTHDLRNDPIEPTDGYFLSYEQAFAGIGGGSQYSRSVASAKGWTSFFGDDVVASLELEGGALFSLGNDPRINDRFTLGGDSFRGFAYSGIGPRDSSRGVHNRKRDDTLGGNFFTMARAQVSFPIGLPDEFGIYGGLFSDVGTLWHLDKTSTVDDDPDSTNFASRIGVDDGADLRATVGATIFWDSGFGPLQLNFAIPVKKEKYDDKEFFRLTVGSRF